jgi:hypothetical protein
MRRSPPKRNMLGETAGQAKRDWLIQRGADGKLRLRFAALGTVCATARNVEPVPVALRDWSSGLFEVSW